MDQIFNKTYHMLALIILMMASGCENGSEKPASGKTKSPRIKKAIKLSSPKSGTQYRVGETVTFSASHKDNLPIDSVILTIGGKQTTAPGSSIDWSDLSGRVGSPKITLTAYQGETKETLYPKVVFLPNETPLRYGYRLISKFPHDEKSYTQGLFFANGTLYESTGHRGESTIQKLDYQTGQADQVVNLGNQYFGEGATLWNNKIYQITWESQKGFIYDFDLNQTGTFNYTGEGWGLTSWGDTLLMTDGFERIYLIDPNDFSQIDMIQAYDHQGKVGPLNELELVDGDLYANTYDSSKDEILIIDLPSGRVKGVIDLNGLIDRQQYRGIDYVLNGIAVTDDGRLFVTHKWSPFLYEIEIFPINDNS